MESRRRSKRRDDLQNIAGGGRHDDGEISPWMFRAFSALVSEIYAISLDRDSTEPALRSVATLTRSQAAFMFAWNSKKSTCRLLEHSVLPPDTPDSFGWLTEKLKTCRPIPSGVNADGILIFSDDDSQKENGSADTTETPDPAIQSSYALLWIVKRRGRALVLALARSTSQGQYTTTDKWLLRELLPHIRLSFSIWEVIEGLMWQKAAGLEALDQLHTGIVLVDQIGRVTFSNLAAEQMCRAGCGLRITRRGIRAISNGANGKLKAAIECAYKCAKGETSFDITPIAIPRSASQHPLVVTCVPIPNRLRFSVLSHPRVILLLRDPDHHLNEKHELLRTLYELTPAEANLAIEIADGQSISAAAAITNTSESTARNALKRIFNKTGVHRQNELGALIGKSLLP